MNTIEIAMPCGDKSNAERNFLAPVIRTVIGSVDTKLRVISQGIELA